MHDHTTEPAWTEPPWTAPFWDERYGSSQRVWSGNPNPQLVAEVAELVPGTRAGRRLRGGRRRALAGPPRLAGHRAGRLRGRAATRRRARRAGDRRPDHLAAGRPARAGRRTGPATTWSAPSSCSFPSALREPLFADLAAAVAPGGTLLLVGHHPSDLQTSARAAGRAGPVLHRRADRGHAGPRDRWDDRWSPTPGRARPSTRTGRRSPSRTPCCGRAGAGERVDRVGTADALRGTTVTPVIRTSSATRPPEVRNAKDAVAQLSRPGPHRVLRGDLGIMGIPGIVFAPEEGLGLPAVAFGHDWLQPAERYADLLRHLASWGFVTAAPANHRGGLPSHAGFAADLRTTLEVCAGVRLGDGRISVDARRTALAGHGIGGGAALLAAVNGPAGRRGGHHRGGPDPAVRAGRGPRDHRTDAAPGRGQGHRRAAGRARRADRRGGRRAGVAAHADQGQAHRVPGGRALERLRALRQPGRQDPPADPGPGHRVPDAPAAGRGPGRGAGGRQGLGHHARPTADRVRARRVTAEAARRCRTPRSSSTRWPPVPPSRTPPRVRIPAAGPSAGRRGPARPARPAGRGLLGQLAVQLRGPLRPFPTARRPASRRPPPRPAGPPGARCRPACRRARRRQRSFIRGPVQAPAAAGAGPGGRLVGPLRGGRGRGQHGAPARPAPGRPAAPPPAAGRPRVRPAADRPPAARSSSASAAAVAACARSRSGRRCSSDAMPGCCRTGRPARGGTGNSAQRAAATTSASRTRGGLRLLGRRGLDHDPDQLLGTRRAQQHPPGPAELRARPPRPRPARWPTRPPRTCPPPARCAAPAAAW